MSRFCGITTCISIAFTCCAANLQPISTKETLDAFTDPKASFSRFLMAMTMPHRSATAPIQTHMSYRAPHTHMEVATRERFGEQGPFSAEPKNLFRRRVQQYSVGSMDDGMANGLSDAEECKKDYEEFLKLVSDDPVKDMTGQTIVEGKAIRFTSKGRNVVLEFPKYPNMLLRRRDASLSGRIKCEEMFELGQMVPVAIKGYFKNYPILSRRRLNRCELEEDLLNAEETGDEIEVKVVGVIPGGAQVSYKGLPLFLPAGACVDGSPAPEALGSMKAVKVLQYDELGATVSEVAARAGEDKERLAELKVGEVVEGRITGVAPFGFYVATSSGLKGLLHISQITSAYVRIENIPLAVGDEIKAMVTKVDIPQLRLQLGTKELEKSPGDILLDPAKVFATAEEVAKEVTEKKEQAKKAIDKELFELLGEGFDMGGILDDN